MTLVVIGPVTRDLIVIGEEKSHKVGGATYYQSFVFEEFFNDYLAIVNCDDKSLINGFPDLDKVRVIEKDTTHFFINRYPHFHKRLSCGWICHVFLTDADIPICPEDLEEILPDEIDAFVINPLNRYDFPAETIDFLKGFNVPIYISIQGFLRLQDVNVNDNYAIKLENFEELPSILSGVDAIFLDEDEANIIGVDYDVDEIVITNGSRGSRIISDVEIRIDPVKCENVVDTTGCGDTFMASYITQKLLLKSSEIAGNFASKIASEKIENFGPYTPNG